MRIGVLVETIGPEAGGRYTFQREIIRSLRDHGGGRGYTFVMMGRWAGGSIPPLPAEHMEYVDIFSSRRLDLKAKWWKIQEVARRLVRPLPHFKVTRFAEFYGRAARVNMFWHLSPNYGATNLPFIYTVWDLQHRFQPWFPEVSDRGEWLERERQYSNVFPRASAIITGTEVGKAEIMEYYNVPPGHIRVIPFPALKAPPEPPADVARQVLGKYGLAENYLLYPARFWPHKNHIGLIMAIQILREKYGLEVPLALVGSGTSLRVVIEKVVKALHMEKQVRVLGFVPWADCEVLYRHALALIMPTFFGPDNLPPLEAFARGCPVIASDVPGAREQLGDAALLVNPRDEHDIARGIKQIHDDESLRRTLTERGYARASKWTDREYVEAVLALFEEFRPVLRCWMPDLI
jgi:glycosyltransferase involved in cell wall biosynthesis